MNIKGIIFDFDGVIVDSEPFWEKADSRLVASEGKEMIPAAKKAVMGMKQSDSIKMIMKMHGIEGDPDEFMKRRQRMMEEYYSNEIPLTPGAFESIGSLNEAGIKMIIASSTPAYLVESCLRRFKLHEFFMSIVSGDDVEHGKPAPDIFLKALSRLALPKNEVVVIEDSLPGLLGARAAEITAVWFRNDHHPDAGVHADMEIGSLKELKTVLRISSPRI